MAGSDTDRIGWLRGLTVAHRGLHDPDGQGLALAENSPSAFAAAVRAGLAIECDVQITADGEAVVFHDFDLDYTTHVQGRVADYLAATLRHVPIAGTRDMIPTLADLLALVRGQVRCWWKSSWSASSLTPPVRGGGAPSGRLSGPGGCDEL
jgi:glycerophosphoryl diester phosphodiesterase